MSSPKASSITITWKPAGRGKVNLTLTKSDGTSFTTRADIVDAAARQDLLNSLSAQLGELVEEEKQALERELSSIAAKVVADSGRPKRKPAASKEEHGTDLPAVVLPGLDVPISDSAKSLGELLASTDRFFVRAQLVCRLERDDHDHPILTPLKPATAASAFEAVAKLSRKKRGAAGEIFETEDICRENDAKLIISAIPFVDQLPPIRVLTRCPVLIERDGKLIEIVGYDRPSGIMAAGEPSPEMTIGEACDLLQTAMQDFRFASESDRSRALAATITPAMVFGGLLNARAPMDLGEADFSQAGKGFRNKVTAAIYSSFVHTVTQRRGGVGGMEETFNHGLIEGRSFICLDNVRGRVDIPGIESFLTESVYYARIPYHGNVPIDPTRTVIMMTSNRAELTVDLANRASIVRILKQPAGYRFQAYPEGNLVQHIQAHPAGYLGAVHRVIREWWRLDRPRVDTASHDFWVWAGTLGYIIEHILGAAPLLLGHDQVKARTTNPNLNWIRDVGLVVVQAERTGEWLRVHQLFDLLVEAGCEIPGLSHGSDADDEANRNRAHMAMGRRLKHCVADDGLSIDGILVERQETLDADGRHRQEYRFTVGLEPHPDSPHRPVNLPPFPAMPREPREAPNIPIESHIYNDACINSARNGDVRNIAGIAGNRGDSQRIEGGFAGDRENKGNSMWPPAPGAGGNIIRDDEVSGQPPPKLTPSADANSLNIPKGWAKPAWIAELRRMAERCREVRPDLATRYMASADALEGGAS